MHAKLNPQTHSARKMQKNERRWRRRAIKLASRQGFVVYHTMTMAQITDGYKHHVAINVLNGCYKWK